mgnify:CR=1 FL=1
MKTVLVAINAKYIHSNLAVYSCVLMQEPLVMNRSYWNLQSTSKKTRF